MERYAGNASGGLFQDGAKPVADFFAYPSFQQMQRAAAGESTNSLQPALNAAFRQSWVSKLNPKPEELR